ncbi:unnamed protein product [Clonostachys rhizophaga]|uniref:Uncharacterized protein n=1 Tax=Clonostachys rhizophaga TaxID=160324 RepID=A0A9N9YE09_9HYPO|nr:unnamed protein product [Clonostachys rhizophaga]
MVRGIEVDFQAMAAANPFWADGPGPTVLLEIKANGIRHRWQQLAVGATLYALSEGLSIAGRVTAFETWLRILGHAKPVAY